jgi:hypothetical protein
MVLKSSCVSYMHAVPVIVIHLPGCTFALCLNECSKFASRTGQVLQRSYCEKMGDCCCVLGHQLAAAEDDKGTFVWTGLKLRQMMDGILTYVSRQAVPYALASNLHGDALFPSNCNKIIVWLSYTIVHPIHPLFWLQLNYFRPYWVLYYNWTFQATK